MHTAQVNPMSFQCTLDFLQLFLGMFSSTVKVPTLIYRACILDS
jgi:hypothetical protein